MTEFFQFNENIVPEASTLCKRTKRFFFRAMYLSWLSPEERNGSTVIYSIQMTQSWRIAAFFPHSGSSLHCHVPPKSAQVLGFEEKWLNLIWTKQIFYEYYNKPHRMLVNRLKPRPFHSSPDFLMQTNGSPTYCPHTMSKVFGKFYQGLFNRFKSEPNYNFSQTKFDPFFD